jgi:hypothetical protein
MRTRSLTRITIEVTKTIIATLQNLPNLKRRKEIVHWIKINKSISC